MTALDPPTLRRACAQMADWLEGRRFGVTVTDGEDPDKVRIAAAAWAEGYRRAIHELRWAAAEPETVPDDLREIDGL